MNYMNPIYALCSVMLFIAAALLTFLIGDEGAQGMVIGALFLGAVGQYLAQSDRGRVVTVAAFLTSAGMGLGAAAVIVTVF